MPLEKQQIQDLVTRYAAGQLTEAEVDAFFDGMQAQEVQEILAADIDTRINDNYAILLSEEKKQLLLEKIKGRRTVFAPVAHRIHFLRTAWFKYAAAIIIIAGIGAYLWSNNKTEKPKVIISQTQKDILPGSDRAILTLSNGEKVELNNNASETIIDGNLSIKNNSGQLTYSPVRSSDRRSFSEGGHSGVGSGTGTYNTMSTPAGGQYKLTLSDGTRAWLNAASSITYPTSFNEKTRTIIITGEVYLEVAQNKTQPFEVKLSDGSLIQVLGTEFNINAYPNEGSIKTTLLNGSIKVSKNNSAKLLSPNQQAIITEKIIIDNNIDTDQIISWKNGIFNFKDADLPTVMRQLERWYDIKVEYEGKINQQFRFRGELQRSLTLSQILKVLERMEVRFKLEGKKLIVNP